MVHEELRMVQAKMVALGSMQVEVRMAREIEARGVVQVMEWCRGGGGECRQIAETGPVLVGMELGIQQVDVKLGTVWMEQVEWEAEKLKAS